MAFIDEDDLDAPPVSLLHRNPTWACLYGDLVRRWQVSPTRHRSRLHRLWLLGHPRVLGADYCVLALLPVFSGEWDAAFVRLWIPDLVDQLRLCNLMILVQDWCGPQAWQNIPGWQTENGKPQRAK